MATPPKPGQGPKTMSSRLATMKFMQRAAASPSGSPSTPEEHSKKRQRMSNGSYKSSPDLTPSSESQIAQAAADQEERKREEASEREGAAKGDTKWYLSMQQAPKPAVDSPLRIVSTGYSNLDSGAASEDAEEPASMPGRLNFGNFSKKPQRRPAGPQASNPKSSGSESESDSEDGEDENVGDDPTGAKAMIAESREAASAKARAERKSKKSAEAAEAARLAEARRKKGVNLNKVSSISGSGKPSASSMACYNCGEKGHMKSDCPKVAKSPKKRTK